MKRSIGAVLTVLVTVATLGCDAAGAKPDSGIARTDFASDVAYANARIEAAYTEMRSLPPKEFRAFMMRNEWRDRWPEMWGPASSRDPEFLNVSTPYAYPDARAMAPFRELHAQDPEAAEEAMGLTVGRPRATLAEFREAVLAGWEQRIEEHARLWDGERCDEW